MTDAAEVATFLKSFEGAATTFPFRDLEWSLWLPEISAGDRPLTPASQLFFPVLLRRGPQVIAIRFFYDCASGKVRYYTGAIPPDLMGHAGLENAISELFRHSLPVEPVRQRKLRGDGAVVERSAAQALAIVPELAVRPSTELMPAPVAQSSAPTMPAPQAADSGVKRVEIEIGHRVRDALLIVAIVCGIVAVVGIAAWTYLAATEDPGVRHHRLQIEELKARNAP